MNRQLPDQTVKTAATDALRQVCIAGFSEIDQTTTATVIESWQLAQQEACGIASNVHQDLTALCRYHRSSLCLSPTPSQLTARVKADVLAASGSPDDLVTGIETSMTELGQAQAGHLYARLLDLVNLGALGTVESLPHEAVKVRFEQDGQQITTEGVINTNLAKTTLVSSFEREVKRQLKRVCSSLVSIQEVIVMQRTDESGQLLPSPSRFLLAQLGPFAIATKPRLNPKPSWWSSQNAPAVSLQSNGRTRGHAASFRGPVLLLTLFGVGLFGLVDQSMVGTACLVLVALVVIVGCLFLLQRTTT